jgi:hypothetical protein
MPRIQPLAPQRTFCVELLDGAMHVWAVLYRATRTRTLCWKKSVESGRIEQIVYKYRASPTVRSIDFIIQCTIPKRLIPQVDLLMGSRPILQRSWLSMKICAPVKETPVIVTLPSCLLFSFFLSLSFFYFSLSLIHICMQITNTHTHTYV